MLLFGAGYVNLDYENKIPFFVLADYSLQDQHLENLCYILLWTADALCLPSVSMFDGGVSWRIWKSAKVSHLLSLLLKSRCVMS